MSLVERNDAPIIRPLHILVPLIKKDLQDGDEAAEAAAKQAGMPFYQAAGEKLKEARVQFGRGEADQFYAWAYRNFGRRETQVREYMLLAKTTPDLQIPGAPASIR